MDSGYSENIIKHYGINMKTEDYDAFKSWWLASKYNQVVIPKERSEQFAKDVWEAAIAYEQDKPIRTYRWDGVIR